MCYAAVVISLYFRARVVALFGREGKTDRKRERERERERKKEKERKKECRERIEGEGEGRE